MISSNFDIEQEFQLLKQQYIPEIDAQCYYFMHRKSGAPIFKIANNDENKTFSIAFKTLPHNNNGVAHILEHSVLNGSLRFPVKSPFDLLNKGSLKTFLNAMTSRDLTEYPVASLNKQDYFNLMHVYLDAVFNPLIYKEPNIFKQEGWHYELKNKNKIPIYKGVVYNEMKGSFSNPQRLLLYYILHTLYPDTPYGKESGGIPSDIVTLTYEEFLQFHQRFYHPNNAIIYFYGNADIKEELSFLHYYYLQNYSNDSTPPQLPFQKPFKKRVEKDAYYPLNEESTTVNQTYFALNFAVGETFNYTLYRALNMLSEVLFNQDSSPVNQALIKNRVGQSVSAFSMDIQQMLFSVVLYNANPSDKTTFRSIINETLKNEIQKGINKDELTAILHLAEFQLREASDAQKGITYFSQIKPGWLYHNDPFIGLTYENDLKIIKEWIHTGYFNSLVEKYILNNSFSSMVTLMPKVGLQKEWAIEEEKNLIQFKKSLSNEKIDQLIEETEHLIEYQNQEDTPEQLATIPTLSLQDIDPKAHFKHCEEKYVNKHKILYREDFTNQIVYTHFFFNLKAIPQELIPYVSLLSYLLGSLDSENYDFSTINRQLNHHTGAFYSTITTFNPSEDDTHYTPYLVIESKFFNHKCETFFHLMEEIILKIIFSPSHLRNLLLKLSSILDSYTHNGFLISQLRASSYFHQPSLFTEQISGISYYRFIRKITEDLDNHLEGIIEQLKKVVSLLFTQNNLISAVICSKEDYAVYEKHLLQFIEKLPNNTPTNNLWNFEPNIKNEGIQSSSQVQYITAGYNYKKLGYVWSGQLLVLSHILSKEWLKNQIRIVGGAYGAYCRVEQNGKFLLSSYRDPNLAETLSIFKETIRYVQEFDVSEEEMTRFIIGTIASLDTPKTTVQNGKIAFNYYFRQRTPQDIQKLRDEILSTTPADIRSFSPLIEQIIKENYYCVYGNKEKIAKHHALFNSIFDIKNIKE